MKKQDGVDPLNKTYKIRKGIMHEKTNDDSNDGDWFVFDIIFSILCCNAFIS